eukprot:XP_027326327.1 serine-rich and transmembrane domain-containing protein 1 isoform X2 [Anas platyrhynchos]
MVSEVLSNLNASMVQRHPPQHLAGLSPPPPARTPHPAPLQPSPRPGAGVRRPPAGRGRARGGPGAALPRRPCGTAAGAGSREPGTGERSRSRERHSSQHAVPLDLGVITIHIRHIGHLSYIPISSRFSEGYNLPLSWV